MAPRKQPNPVRYEVRGNRVMAIASWMGTRLRPSFATRDEAEAWGKDQTIRMIRGQEIQPPADARGKAVGHTPRTLQELYEHVRDTHWMVSGPNGGPKKSWPKIKVQVEQALAALGRNTALAKLTVPYIEGKLRDMEQERGNTPRTTNRRMAYLGLMLKEAARLGCIERPPAMKKAPEVTEGRIFRITPVLERDMLIWALAKTPAFYDFIVLSLYLGQRQNETLRIRVTESLGHPQDGYFDGTEFAIFPSGTAKNKSTVSRAVPLRPIVAEVVNRHRAASKGEGARVFESVTGNMVNHWFQELRAQFLLDRHPEIVRQKRDGLPVGKDFCIHIMRSEFCSRLGDEGYRLAEIAEYSGHTTLSTCQRYVKPNKMAHRARLLREGKIELGLPGGEVPDFAPTQVHPSVTKGRLSLVHRTVEASPTIDPATAVEMIKALQAAGLGDKLQELVAGMKAKKA